MRNPATTAVIDATAIGLAILLGIHLAFTAAAALAGHCSPWIAAIIAPFFLYLTIRLAAAILHHHRTTNRRRFFRF